MTRTTALATLLAVSALVAGAPAAADDAEQVFQFYCAQCHGLQGKGDGPNVSKEFPVDPRNFTEAKEMEKLSDADIRNVILDVFTGLAVIAHCLSRRRTAFVCGAIATGIGGPSTARAKT